MSEGRNKFKSDWESFACWVKKDREKKKESDKSSMWRGLIECFGIRDYPSNHAVIFEENVLRSYNLLSKSQETLGFKMKKSVLSISYALARAASYFRNRVWRINSAGLGSGHLIHHPAGLRWLREVGVYADYEKFCNSFQMSLNSGNSIKSFYLSSVIARNISGIQSPRILEIGGGAGNLAAMIYFKHRPSCYLIIDLPEMLLHSSLTLKALYPDVPAHFVYAPSEVASLQEGGFYFLTPDCVAGLTPDSFDFAINIDSFQEMTENQVAQYIRLVQAVVKQDGYFLNMNRRKYLEEEHFDNNPLLYPYDRRNHIVRWETDLFMAKVYNFNQVRTEGWMLRLEQVRKNSESVLHFH